MRLDQGSLRALARRLLRSDPRAAVRTILRGDLARLLAGPEQRVTLDRLQAAMSVIEGHAEHVMDAATRQLDPGYARLRGRLEARRTIEALRYGLVPAKRIRELSVGLEAEKASLQKALTNTKENGGDVRVVVGEYGTGKSHRSWCSSHLWECTAWQPGQCRSPQPSGKLSRWPQWEHS